MSKSLEEKWKEVKHFYENCGYKHPASNVPVRFACRPSLAQVEFLFNAMQKFKATTKDYFFREPFLLERLNRDYERRTGKKKEES